MKDTILPALYCFVAVLLGGCAIVTQNDLELSDRKNRLEIKKRCEGTPAEYAANQLFGPSQSYMLRLSGAVSATRERLEEDRHAVRKIHEDIKAGLAWKNPVVQIEIPFAAEAPVIDGNIEETEWSNAFVSKGSYQLGETFERVKSGEIWKLMWDETFFYIGVKFPDACVIAPELPRDGTPFIYDSFEIFILPEFRTKSYWEIVVSPNKSLFDSLQTALDYGGWDAKTEEDLDGLLIGVRIVQSKNKQDNFYMIEVAVPWRELPAYTKGNKPFPGESVYLNLIRTQLDKLGLPVEYYSFQPLLYSGHNIWGMSEGVLKR